LSRHAQLVNRERFLQTFFQTTGGAGIQIHQLSVQTHQHALGFYVIHHGVGILEFPFYIGLVLLRKMVHHMALLVDLATLDETGLAGVPAHCRVQGLATVENIQPRGG
jgi:hypothetical protein